jgi:hypothetical protein
MAAVKRLVCYLSWHLYCEKFGEMLPSGISRETQSNSDGWALGPNETKRHPDQPERP